MDPRYKNPRIEDIWSPEKRLARWDRVELSAIDARVKLGLESEAASATIRFALEQHPTDIRWWLERDALIHHDVNAYIDERRRHLPPELQPLFHEDMTSMDTQEPAHALALIESAMLVEEGMNQLKSALRDKAFQYRYMPFLGRTHGQGAKLRSFGSRLLTWYAPLLVPERKVREAVQECHASRLSGAIGNFGGELSPEIERLALEPLGLHPFAGATQILPRVVHATLAQALRLLCEELGKAALDIRLGARSGKPICREPFGKEQKGSSAMPHKRNPISMEQMEGMARLAAGYEAAIVKGIETWEDRAIEQSCVERVAWPDMFHVTLHMLAVMRRVISRLEVYPDHMLQEIVEEKGTYASDEAKNFLADLMGKRGLEAEIAYRIVQLASFNAFEPKGFWAHVRRELPHSLEDADKLVARAQHEPRPSNGSIRDLIRIGGLQPVESLKATPEEIEQWNMLLREIFSDDETERRWDERFTPSYLLKQESHIYTELLGV